MNTLMIKDLSVAQELDRDAMTAVRGGMYKDAGFYWPPYYGESKHDFSFQASQTIGQTQNVLNNNGNNVAFAAGIQSTVNPTQAAANNISF